MKKRSCLLCLCSSHRKLIKKSCLTYWIYLPFTYLMKSFLTRLINFRHHYYRHFFSHLYHKSFSFVSRAFDQHDYINAFYLFFGPCCYIFARTILFVFITENFLRETKGRNFFKRGEEEWKEASLYVSNVCSNNTHL